MTDLDSYRDSIDKLDRALVLILAERFEITCKIGLLKKKDNLLSVDKERERDQVIKIKNFAIKYGLNPDIAEKVLRFIIDEVVRNHQELQNGG